MAELQFHRALKQGSVGRDVLAVKRGLWRAGHMGGPARKFTPLFGPFAVRALKSYQRTIPVQPTGLYGLKTHEHLIQHFDARARDLYERASKEQAKPVPNPDPPPKPPVGALKLPQHFRVTHQTAGLPGYGAVDVFAKPGTPVLPPEGGMVVKHSGRDPRTGGSPGGAYGWSVYLKGDSGATYFMTHFGTRTTMLFGRVNADQVIGTVCDSAVSGKPGTSHIHHGKNA